MTRVFADTYYFLALLNPREQHHAAAIRAAVDPQLYLVTTEWVLTELGDAFCRPGDRDDFIAIDRSLQSQPRVKVVAADSQYFQRGVELFEQRGDKSWSLTDCLSFVAMHDEGLTAALTADKHFEQAGFVVLFK